MVPLGVLLSERDHTDRNKPYTTQTTATSGTNRRKSHDRDTRREGQADSEPLARSHRPAAWVSPGSYPGHEVRELREEEQWNT